MNNFAFGFIIGSLFNLFVIWFSNKIYIPENNGNKNKKNLKDIEKTMNQKDKQLKDLSLTIKNLHINHHEKETKKDIVCQDQEKNNNFSLINIDK